MTNNFEEVRNLSRVIGKPILIIKNLSEDITYHYLLDEYVAYNPSDHIYENFVNGREVTQILNSMSSFASGMIVGGYDVSIMQKVDTILPVKFYFPENQNLILIRVLG